MKSFFFPTDQVSSGCAECPGTFNMVFLVQKLSLRIHFGDKPLHFGATPRADEVQKTDKSHFVARGRCAIDNDQQFASVGRVSTIQDHTAAQL